MSKRTVVPFGPQHPVLPEPVHLDLVLEDETVVNAIPRIGYVHRGLEKLVEKRDYTQFVYVTERICGIWLVRPLAWLFRVRREAYGHRNYRSRCLPARYLPRALPYAQPPAVARPAGRWLWLRGPVHACLAFARDRSRHLRAGHGRPRHLLRLATWVVFARRFPTRHSPAS